MRLLPIVAVFASCAGRGSPAPALRDVSPNELRSPADFEAVRNETDRSRSLFLEMHRVLSHPRCVNCHPAGDVPHQGPSLALHEPPVVRGPEDHGVVGMACETCHQDRNQDHTRVPGAPKWAVAPIEMAWVGRTPAQICAQIKDPARNDGKTLAELVEHNAHDALVAWGWAPGADREPAPGTQEQFGALTAAWVVTGAACPEETP